MEEAPSSRRTPRPAAAVGLVAAHAAGGAGKGCAYVLEAETSAGNDLAVVALSGGSVRFYALQDAAAALAPAGEARALASGAVSATRLAGGGEPVAYCATASGGVVAVDARQPGGGVAQRFDAASAGELWCLDLGGPGEAYLCAGADDAVLFWDRRSAVPVKRWDEAFHQAVTQVAFHPTKRSELYVGGVDGLVSVFDCSGALDDDEGMVTVMSVGTDVRRVGFYGRGAQKLWCLTNIEDIHAWDATEMPRLGDPVGKLEGTRAAFVHSPAIDYLVDCAYDDEHDTLWLVGGTQTGEVALAPVLDPESPGDGAQLGVGAPLATLRGAHTEPVRCAEWRATPGGWRCLTGGEDGKLCLWVAGKPDDEDHDAEMTDAPGAIRTSKGRRPVAPY